ncbi:hypothetical protein PILCRDRAFT_828057 [Piloderma croceum F 1598]|uniref:Uncharacterized protein n=1 Tax=Piloderma croceum (strain F 1598) TaxID=765440 RepID=A0A0C3F3P2_PILCF|nr:hypothetical protein PILCRDRAFT_828057 [Piloderma croceum F 1598]
MPYSTNKIDMKQDVAAEQKSKYARDDRTDPNATKNSPYTSAGFCVKVVRVVAASI